MNEELTMTELYRRALEIKNDPTKSYEAADAESFVFFLSNLPKTVKVSAKKCVYVFETDTGIIKIGISATPEQRFKNLCNAGGHKLINTFISEPMENAQVIERRVQKYFEDKRKVGEYFDCTFEDAVSVLQKIIKEAVSDDR